MRSWRSLPSRARRSGRFPARPWPLAISARWLATCQARDGFPRACSAQGGDARRRDCAPSLGPPRHAHMPLGNSGRCGYGAARQGCGKPTQRRRVNFRGNLLGIAFDPSNPARGYAVGQEGVLLRYGKSWTQDNAAGRSRRRELHVDRLRRLAGTCGISHSPSSEQRTGAHYTGGLLVNDGSGWRVDQDAAAALAGGLPWAVAGLPDGGAALSGVSSREEPLVLERESSASAWHPTSVPYAGGEPPGSLALFREGGALRVVGSGGIPNTGAIDFPEEHAPPAGFPPQLIKAYPPADRLRPAPDGGRLERRGARPRRGRGSPGRIQALRRALQARSDERRPDRSDGPAGLGGRRPARIAPSPRHGRRRTLSGRWCSAAGVRLRSRSGRSEPGGVRDRRRRPVRRSLRRSRKRHARTRRVAVFGVAGGRPDRRRARVPLHRAAREHRRRARPRCSGATAARAGPLRWRARLELAADVRGAVTDRPRGRRRRVAFQAILRGLSRAVRKWRSGLGTVAGQQLARAMRVGQRGTTRSTRAALGAM